jgi:hypothetical protein
MTRGSVTPVTHHPFRVTPAVTSTSAAPLLPVRPAAWRTPVPVTPPSDPTDCPRVASPRRTVNPSEGGCSR